jgi:hypothetical protein
VTSTLTWKRHKTGIYSTSIDADATRSYRTYRVTGGWLVEVYATKKVGTEQYRDVTRPVLDAMTVDTLPLAKAATQQYADLGDDYQQHEHGGRSRATEAVIRAYDADKTARA